MIEWEKDVIVVTLSGTLNFDRAFEFRKKSLRHFIQNKVVFSLKGLNFVGSTGMSSFIETLAEISERNPNGLKVCEASIEYKRLLEPYIGEKLRMYTSLDELKSNAETTDHSNI